MQSGWCARLFFAVVGALALAGLVTGTACTRWGQPGPVTPTIAPLSSLFVDANAGSDTTGNGSIAKPFKTLTKAVAVLIAAKEVASSVIITMAIGSYTAANGEIFPIVIPKIVTIKGSGYGRGPKSGTFINGAGEDTIFEKLVHAPARTAFATLEVVPPANVGTGVGISNVYVGATKISLPGSNAFYASLDAIGTVSASDASFGSGILATLRNLDGVLVAGGSFTCTSCAIHGNDFGIGGLSVPLPTASPYASAPTISLLRGDADSSVAAKVFDIITDGSVNVTASGETFAKAQYAFSDSLSPVLAVPVRGAVDFGGGATQSIGGNGFIGARHTEIDIVRRNETVYALDDVWNPNEQRADLNGRYKRRITFKEGAAGKNVTIVHDATGSTVTVGPAPVPTPTPSTTPSTGPTSTPT
ncbi:MAG: DUF1565 domain-containing protein [Candidatus Cybelea sp.]